MTYPLVTVVGSVVKESLELRFGQSGKAFARFRIKISDRKKDGANWVDTEPIWQQIIAFDKIAENLCDTVEAGDTVVVLGRIEPNVWTDKDGKEHRDTQIVAYEIGASVRWNSWDKRDEAAATRPSQAAGGFDSDDSPPPF